MLISDIKSWASFKYCDYKFNGTSRNIFSFYLSCHCHSLVLSGFNSFIGFPFLVQSCDISPRNFDGLCPTNRKTTECFARLECYLL